MAIPHFAVPFQIVNGSATTVEQDTVDEIAQCVEMIVRTSKGSRIEVRDFGVPDLLLTEITPNADREVLAAINQWEPRASAAVSDRVSTADDLVRELGITVKVANVDN